MTIGTGTFFPQGQFSFIRPYVGNFAVPSVWNLESHSAHQFVFNDFGIYNDRIFINLFPAFWGWTTNNYTLDHIVTDCYYHALPSTVDTPTPFSLTFVPATPTRLATLKLLSPYFATTLQYFPLPARDQPYWMPDL